MSGITPPDIEAYCTAHTVPPTSLLAALAAATATETDLPQMQVGPLEGAFLRLLARIVQARDVLEIGTFTGYSALCLAEGAAPDATVTTIDIDPDAVDIAKRHWADSPHGSKIRALLGDARRLLPGLEGPFDLVFIDADKTNYLAYWEEVVPKVRPGGLIVVDNVLWSGRVLQPAAADDHAIVRLNTHAAHDPRVECVMLPVRDGMLLAWKHP